LSSNLDSDVTFDLQANGVPVQWVLLNLAQGRVFDVP
jgi:hypothetical protein